MDINLFKRLLGLIALLLCHAQLSLELSHALLQHFAVLAACARLGELLKIRNKREQSKSYFFFSKKKKTSARTYRSLSLHAPFELTDDLGHCSALLAVFLLEFLQSMVAVLREFLLLFLERG